MTDGSLERPAPTPVFPVTVMMGIGRNNNRIGRAMRSNNPKIRNGLMAKIPCN